MNYKITGENNSEVLLFIHGLGASLSQFEKQHDYFSNKYKVVSVSLFSEDGHSNQDNGSIQTDYSLEKIANDLITLLDGLNIKTFHYIGNSMGGNIGFEILKSNPQRMLTLTTFGTTGELKTSKIKLTIIKKMYRIMSMKLIASLASSTGVSIYAKNSIRDMLLKSNKETVLKLLPHLSNFNYTDILKNVDIPIMILRGSKDKEINQTLKSTLTALATNPNFQLKDLKGVGHFINIDDPELFNSILSDFLSNGISGSGL